jgi:hypothetical protein
LVFWLQKRPYSRHGGKASRNIHQPSARPVWNCQLEPTASLHVCTVYLTLEQITSLCRLSQCKHGSTPYIVGHLQMEYLLPRKSCAPLKLELPCFVIIFLPTLGSRLLFVLQVAVASVIGRVVVAVDVDMGLYVHAA